MTTTNKLITKIANFLLVFSFLGLIFLAGYKTGEIRSKKQTNPITEKLNLITDSNNITNKPKENIDFSLFWEAWNAVENLYIDKSKIDPQKMYYGAIKGMVASLGDPYTFFLTPEENKESKLDLEGKFEGIGAQLGMKNDQIVIISPLKNSPAERSGIKTGDIITKVDGQSTAGWTLTQAVSKIRGEKGSKVVLTVYRDDKEIDIPIIRDEIKIPSIEFQVKNSNEFGLNNSKNFAYIKIIQFGTETNQEWDKTVEDVLAKIKSNSISGIVLDLRNNPGGLLNSSIYLAEDFLKKGDLIVKQEFVNKDPIEYISKRNGRLYGTKLIILVNKGSASASEILAGALQDHKKAVIVGEQTFGKGSVQQAIDLSNSAGLHITISKWILPDGKWINDTGITPDIVVTANKEQDNNQEQQKSVDEQLNKAVEQLFKN
ncbi:MAG: peptidase S41 [Patescibacteria group bacterium]|nr:MAG: peptidase S41 [Patescibacteria group bacterium]